MSVLVATAYMEEAERFDWLVAMDAGKIIATGTPAELKAKRGASTRSRTLSSHGFRKRSARARRFAFQSAPPSMTRR